MSGKPLSAPATTATTSTATEGKAFDTNVKLSVFVAGGTGNTGAATINHLLNTYPNITVTAGVRNLEKARNVFAKASADRLKFAHFDVKGDTITGDKSKDAAVLKGFDALVIVPPQAFDNRFGLCNAYLEAAAAKGTTIKHIVLISAPAARKPELIVTKAFYEVEQRAMTCGVPVTFMHAVFFFENQMMNATTIKSDGAFYYACKPDAPIPLVSVRDIGDATANVVAQGPTVRGGKTYPIASDIRTWSEIAAVYTKALGKPIKFVQLTDEQAAEAMVKMGFPENLAKGANLLMHDFERTGKSYSTQPLTELLGRQPETFEQWLVPRLAAFKS